jgi:hypothetical protein
MLLLTLTGCPSLPVQPPHPLPVPPGPTPPLPAPIVPPMQSRIQPLLDQELSGPQEMTRRALANATGFPAAAKTSLALQTLADPWAGMAAIEARGLAVAAAAQQGRPGLATLLVELATGMDRSGPRSIAHSSPPPPSLDAFLDALALQIEQAAHHREQALRQMSQADRQFLFDHGAAIVELFIPQISAWNDRIEAEAEADRRFAAIIQDSLDDTALLASAQTLLRLLDQSWVQQMAALPADAGHDLSPPSGVTGEVLAVRETPVGLIVIGGPGRNSYDLGPRFALVIDIGGDDLYRGLIGATASLQHGISVVIDLSGNDRYESAPLGLATGRLGTGLVADLSGNDEYLLADGSGGTGFAGIGLLYDEAGDDRYTGERLVLGASVGGLGAVVDLSGADTYAGGGYAGGFGGPLGVGALIDVAGNDAYICGTIPSPYNQQDAPAAPPGDPTYQYDCFGLGVGAGKRVFSPQRDHLLYGLAGGVGLLLDLSGDDRYRSANFSQGAGYFFGVGVKLDLDGQDEHAAARYGVGAGAHFGVGLFLDGRGRDRYTSTGPVYTGAAAWDVSVMLAIDAGSDNDVYDFHRSSGLGIADHRAWSLFIDEGGHDRYLVPTGLGAAHDQSLSGFFDLSGRDTYGTSDDPTKAAHYQDGGLVRDPSGGLFVDQE